MFMINYSHYVLIYMWYQNTWLIEFMILDYDFSPILINPKFEKFIIELKL